MERPPLARHTSPPAALAAERDALVRLAYELLDAHDDTARLATQPDPGGLAWDGHLAYLRDLQRVGRELLAQAAG
ncbi:MAG TPA: hypothetical protein VFS37_16320 [Conexibacter sp.]|nr:hypothetical protein [Conexibacter sp.]